MKNILHLSWADAGGASHFFTEAIRQHYPVNIRAIRQTQNYLDYPYDILNPTREQVLEWIDWAELIHVHDNAYIAFEPVRNALAQKDTVLMHYHGTMYRNNAEKCKKICNTHKWPMVVSTVDLCLVDGAPWLPTPRPDYGSRIITPDGFSICHAPTDRKVKSTDVVIKAAEYTGIKLDLIEKQDYASCIDRKRRSSLLVDQFILGYGSNAIEAWSLGLPVICSADQPILDAIESVVGVLPFCNVRPKELAAALNRFKNDLEFRKGWAKRGREVYEKFHSYESVAKITMELYAKISGDDSYLNGFEPNRPMVSVIIPCYGYSRFLDDAIASLDKQTFKDFEVIIVNDGDEEFAPGAFVRNHQKVRIVSLDENVGTAEALNQGILKSSGKYISILSADDMMEPYRLKELLETSHRHPHGFIYDDLTVVGSMAHRLNNTTKVGDKIIRKVVDKYDFDYVLQKNGIHAGIFYPRNAWLEVGGYPIEFKSGREDWAMNVKLGSFGWCGYKAPNPGYVYRRGEHNRTNSNKTDNWKKHFAAQMRKTFAPLYNGERPMPCCGGNQVIIKQQNIGGTVMTSPLVGSTEGLVEISYVGLQVNGTQDWIGPYTGIRYVFSGVSPHKDKWVDRRDAYGVTGNNPVKGFLNIQEHNRAVFVLKTDPLQNNVQEEIVVKVQEPTAPVAPVITNDEKNPILDPGALNVPEIKKFLRTSEIALDDLELMIQNERDGKARTSVIDAIEAILYSPENL